MPPSTHELNDRFAVADHIRFEAGSGGLPTAVIENRHAVARVSLLGGQVLAYQPRGQRPVLWLSPNSQFAVGSAIRGGIPVCWPWFAGHPTDDDKPSHGFVRTRLWQVGATAAGEDGATRLELVIESNSETRSLWPHDFVLSLVITVGADLAVTLTVHNRGNDAFTYTGALHSYFAVSAIEGIRVEGLAGKGYLDKRDDRARKQQQGPITFSAPTDRIYLDTTDTCTIHDPDWSRSIRVAKRGSATTVVWNPWRAWSRATTDMGEGTYRGMVCVEAAKAEDDGEEVAPGGEHRLGTTIRVDPLG